MCKKIHALRAIIIPVVGSAVVCSVVVGSVVVCSVVVGLAVVCSVVARGVVTGSEQQTGASLFFNYYRTVQKHDILQSTKPPNDAVTKCIV